MIPATRATAERVALGDALAAQQLHDPRATSTRPGRGGRPSGDVLGGHVDHPGGPDSSTWVSRAPGR